MLSVLWCNPIFLVIPPIPVSFTPMILLFGARIKSSPSIHIKWSVFNEIVEKNLTNTNEWWVKDNWLAGVCLPIPTQRGAALNSQTFLVMMSHSDVLPKVPGNMPRNTHPLFKLLLYSPRLTIIDEFQSNTKRKHATSERLEKVAKSEPEPQILTPLFTRKAQTSTKKTPIHPYNSTSRLPNKSQASKERISPGLWKARTQS